MDQGLLTLPEHMSLPPVFSVVHIGRYLVLKKHSDSSKTFSETDIIYMLEFLIDNIFVIFGGCVFQQTVGIPTGTNCAPFSPTCSFIRMRPDPLISRYSI